MQRCAGSERQITNKEAPRLATSAVTGNTLFEFENAAGTEGALSTQIRMRIRVRLNVPYITSYQNL